MTLSTINLASADPQRAKRFYVTCLGMVEDVRRSADPNFVYLTSARADLTLARSPDGGAPDPSRTTEIGFETDDLDALRATLAREGIAAREERMGWGDVVELRDPDGHRVIVYAFGRSN